MLFLTASSSSLHASCYPASCRFPPSISRLLTSLRTCAGAREVNNNVNENRPSPGTGPRLLLGAQVPESGGGGLGWLRASLHGVVGLGFVRPSWQRLGRDRGGRGGAAVRRTEMRNEPGRVFSLIHFIS
eukprot:762949-Hanusia_phi.AAC.10